MSGVPNSSQSVPRYGCYPGPGQVFCPGRPTSSPSPPSSHLCDRVTARGKKKTVVSCTDGLMFGSLLVAVEE